MGNTFVISKECESHDAGYKTILNTLIVFAFLQTRSFTCSFEFMISSLVARKRTIQMYMNPSADSVSFDVKRN